MRRRDIGHRASDRGRRRRTGAAVAGIVALAFAAPAAGQIVFEGLVTDGAGNPVPDADLDFFDSQSGIRVDPSAPGYEGQEDKTDAFGYYEMVLVPEVYDVRFEPPEERTDLAPVFHRGLLLGWDTVLDVTLSFGSRFTGRVVNPDGLPVGDVDLDFTDPETGRRIASVRDDTGPDGFFATTVQRGVWDVSFQPPKVLGVGPLQIDAVDLGSDATLNVTLPRGHLVSGRIESELGRPVFFADLDVEERTGRRIPTSDDNTDAGGRFEVNVPEGTFHVFATAPTGLPFAPAARYDVVVDRDLDLGLIVLRTGAVLSGTAFDPDGAPLTDTDLDLRQPGSCDRYPVPGAVTDGAGAFSIRVEEGTYDFVLSPPDDSPLAPYRFDSVAIDVDRTIQLAVPDWAPQLVGVTSRITAPDGRGLDGATVRAEPLGAGAPWEAITAPDGSFAKDVIPGRYGVEIVPPTGIALDALRLPALELPCGLPEAVSLREAEAPVLASSSLLLRSLPNPWKSRTSFTVNLTQAVPGATVEVFNVTGRRIRTLHRGPLPSGPAEFAWDGVADNGNPVASGMYFVLLQGDGVRYTAKTSKVDK